MTGFNLSAQSVRKIAKLLANPKYQPPFLRRSEEEQLPLPTPHLNWIWARGVSTALPRYTPLAISIPVEGSRATAADPEHDEIIISATLSPNSAEQGNICVAIDPVPAGDLNRLFRVAVSGLTYVRAVRPTLGTTEPYRLNSNSLSISSHAINASNTGDFQASWIEDPFVPVNTPYLALINLDRNAQTVVTGQVTVLFHAPAGGIPGATFDGTSWTFGTANCQSISPSTGLLSGTTSFVRNAGGFIPAGSSVFGHMIAGTFYVNCCGGGAPDPDPDPEPPIGD